MQQRGYILTGLDVMVEVVGRESGESVVAVAQGPRVGQILRTSIAIQSHLLQHSELIICAMLFNQMYIYGIDIQLFKYNIFDDCLNVHISILQRYGYVNT